MNMITILKPSKLNEFFTAFDWLEHLINQSDNGKNNTIMTLLLNKNTTIMI